LHPLTNQAFTRLIWQAIHGLHVYSEFTEYT
jgi:hypothetical protein